MAPPDDPTDLKKRSWLDTLKRTFTEFKEDNLTDGRRRSPITPSCRCSPR